jgi:chaperonin cofactor prefoldin
MTKATISDRTGVTDTQPLDELEARLDALAAQMERAAERLSELSQAARMAFQEKLRARK